MEKITNLKEKIYLLTYGKPNYITKISNNIYENKDKKQIFDVIRKLRDDKWIEQIPMKSDIKDGRSMRRQYYRANVKPLLDSILEDLKEKDITLTSKEKKSLKRYLDSKSFRTTVFEIIEKNGKLRSKNINFSTIKRNLCYLSTYMIFIKQWMEGRVFRVHLAESLLEIMTHPIFSLESSLCEKLKYLDPYTSSLAFSSFKDVQDMIEDTFKPVIKDVIKKVDRDTREKILKEVSGDKHIRIQLESDTDIHFELIKKKKL